MAAQDAHAADPARVPAEEVRARARLFRSVVEADGRRTNADEEGSLMVSLIQRVDYSNQLLLALLNTQRAAVSALFLRTLCGLLIVVHSSMPVLFLAGALAISPGSRPCVRFPLPLRLVLPVPLPLLCLPLLLPLLWLLCLRVCLLSCLPRCLRLLFLRPPVLVGRRVVWARLVWGLPLRLRLPRASGPERRLPRSHRRSSPLVVAPVVLRVPVVRRVPLVRLRPSCVLPLLGRGSLFFSFSFSFSFFLYLVHSLRAACVVCAVGWWLFAGWWLESCLRVFVVLVCGVSAWLVRGPDDALGPLGAIEFFPVTLRPSAA